MKIQTTNTLLAFGLFSLSLYSPLSEAQSLSLECENKTQISCAVQAYEIDEQQCAGIYSATSVDLKKLALQKTQAATGELETEESKAWLERGKKHYNICMLVEGQSVQSANSWSNQLALGYMFQSDYDENGTNLGFEEQSAVAQVAFNGRWLYEDNTLSHWEIGALFGKSPAYNKKNNNPPNSLSVPKFTDVNGSVDIYTKITYTPTWAMAGNQDTLSSYFTFGALIGSKTREKLTTEKDSVVFYGGLIGEFYFYGKNVRHSGNDIPRGRIMFGPVLFEEYGGAKDELRWLFTGEWNLTGGSSGDIVAGIKANVGEGVDDTGVFIAVRKDLNSLSEFFGFGNK